MSSETGNKEQYNDVFIRAAKKFEAEEKAKIAEIVAPLGAKSSFKASEVPLNSKTDLNPTKKNQRIIRLDGGS